MERYIHVARADREFIEKAFGVTGRTIRNALSFDKKRGETDTARRIRRLAVERGGVVMVAAPEVETLHDHDGMISQYFPNGAKLELDKSTGGGVVTFKGDEVARYEDVSINRLAAIQHHAAALTADRRDLARRASELRNTKSL